MALIDYTILQIKQKLATKSRTKKERLTMAHHRKAVAAAAALNSGIFVVEAVAGYQAGSLALLMDSVHNLSDEMGLVLLYLAFILPLGVSRNLLRSANVFN